jgi:hypothetical protein
MSPSSWGEEEEETRIALHGGTRPRDQSPQLPTIDPATIALHAEAWPPDRSLQPARSDHRIDAPHGRMQAAIKDSSENQEQDPYADPLAVTRWPKRINVPALLRAAESITPWLNVTAWEEALRLHPDRDGTNRFLAAITNGDDIRYTGPRDKTVEWNSPESKGADRLRWLAILRKEQLRGHFVGPFRKDEILF